MAVMEQILVPESLLKSSELSSSAKIVWITLLIDSHLQPELQHTKTSLSIRTGLSRPTIYKSLDALKSGGWHSTDESLDKTKLQSPLAAICIDMILNKALSIRARLLHGLLQLTSGFKDTIKQFKYSSLSEELHIGVKTIRNSVRQLVRSGWLAMEQVNQLAPIIFTFGNPIKEQFKAMKARAERNLSIATYKGEALMKEFLSLIAATDDYMDNSRPGFLRNAETDGLMELDRYYPNIAAFEFNGAQHYKPTDLYDAETVEKQRSRDLLKKQLCTDKGIELVVVHPQDLTLAGMLSKVRGLLPLRGLRSGEGLVGFLERFSANYRRNVPDLAGLTVESSFSNVK